MLKSFIILLGVVFSLTCTPAMATVSTGAAHPTEIKGFNKLKGYIFEAEQRTGTSAELLTALLSIESTMGNHTVNPSSSARGVMQYTSKTWRADLKKYHKELGLSANASVTNARAAILVAAAALADNKQYLERVTGRTISSGDLYMSHFVGLGGAVKILKGKSSTQVSRLVAVHSKNGKRYHVKGKVATVAQFRAKMNGLIKNETRKYTVALNQSRLDNLMVALSTDSTLSVAQL